jgi:hypothetical protein
VARRYYRQEQQNTCAVAALRTVLALQFGVVVESEQVLEVLGTTARDAIRENGTDTSKLRDMVKGAARAFHTGRPWTLKVRLHASLRDLRAELGRHRYPLVRIFERAPDPDYHMIVLLRLAPTRVLVWDPGMHHTKRPLWRSLDWFLDSWSDPHGATWYGVVNAQTKPTRGT